MEMLQHRFYSECFRGDCFPVCHSLTGSVFFSNADIWGFDPFDCITQILIQQHVIQVSICTEMCVTAYVLQHTKKATIPKSNRSLEELENRLHNISYLVLEVGVE